MDVAAKARAQITLTVQVDIQSVWWYYKLQSSTAARPPKPTVNPPSGWTLTEPSYTEGSTNTLYFVELTVFTDGSFQYTDVSVDSSYEAAKAAYNLAHAAQESVGTLAQQVDQQSARLDILSDSIQARVEKVTYDQDMEGVREQVSAQYTDFTQTADGMKAEIGELKQDGDELRAYVRYGLENGVGTLSLGQTDSAYKAVINNTGFTIQQDGSDMTYARKNILSAPVVEARRVFQQGSYTVKVQADGGLMWN